MKIVREQRRAARVGRAFTLVELLVAVTLSTLIVLSVVSAARALGHTRERVAARVERSYAARRALDEIAAALRNVRYEGDPERPALVGYPPDASGAGRLDLLVTDARRVRPEGAESDECETSFFVGRPRGYEMPVLLQRRDHGLDDAPDHGGIVQIVAEGITELRFEFHADGRWVDQWPATETRLPEAVRVTVAAVAPAKERPSRAAPLVLTTAVALRVDAVRPTRPERPGPRIPGQPPEGARP